MKAESVEARGLVRLGVGRLNSLRPLVTVVLFGAVTIVCLGNPVLVWIFLAEGCAGSLIPKICIVLGV